MALAVVMLIAGVGGAVSFLGSGSATVTHTQPATESTRAGGGTVTDPQFPVEVPPTSAPPGARADLAAKCEETP